MQNIYDIVLYAQQETIKAIKPGISVSELDSVARNIITEANLGEYFGHGTGHGIGLSVHESPIIKQSTDSTLDTQHSTLLKGMVFTVEPGVYVPGLGGVRIEDMVLVTEDGYEVLTSLPK